MTSNRSFFLIVLLFLAAGCTKPAGDYLFQSAETARERGGRYEFQLSLEDSTRQYETFLAARLVTSRIPGGNIVLDVQVTSPEGETAIERLTLPLGDPDAARIALGSGSLADYQWPWRTLRPSGAQLGTWQVAVVPTDPETADAFYGFGLSYEGTPWEKGN